MVVVTLTYRSAAGASNASPGPLEREVIGPPLFPIVPIVVLISSASQFLLELVQEAPVGTLREDLLGT